MKWIGTILLMLLAGVAGKLIYQKVFAPPSDVPPGASVGSREHLRAIAAKMNETLPRQVDPDTRVTRVFAREKEFVYEVELTRLSSRQIDFQAFVREAGAHIRKTACATPQMKPFWDHGITATYNYTASDNFALGSISVSKKDCS